MSDDDPTRERWLPVVGYEGSYEVSDLGRVRGLGREVFYKDGRSRWVHGQLLNPRLKADGPSAFRRTVGLRAHGVSKRFYVYVLVLEAFDQPRPGGLVARHLNGNSLDDRAVNLEWGTHSENSLDTVAHGTHNHKRKTRCSRRHPLEEPNLIPSQLDNWGRRNCLACARARIVAQKDPTIDFQEESDRQYASLLASPGRRQGRAVGEAQARAVMTEKTVRSMRCDYAAGAGIKKLAARYGVGKTQTWNIVSGRSWSHVPMEVAQ